MSHHADDQRIKLKLILKYYLLLNSVKGFKAYE